MSSGSRFLRFAMIGSQLAILGSALVACAGSNGNAASNKVFYDTKGAVGAVADTSNVEHRYPPLDATNPKTGARQLGVSVLFDGVRFARPANWSIRDAGIDHGQAFIRYVSPHAFSFALYERSDSPVDPWRDIVQRYEDDVTGVGGTMVAKKLPVAGGVSQGREYVVTQKSGAGEAEPPSHSHELLLRSPHRVVLVQVTTQDESFSRIGDEVLDALRKLEVL